MKGTPLIQTRDPDLIIRCNNLGLKLVSNLPHAITEGELGYWENHLDELKGGLRNGLGLDREEVAPTSPDPVFEFPRTFKAKSTNLDEIIPVTEHFAKKFLGVTVNLREQFDFPVELPWASVLLVFDPGLNNRQAVEKALKGQNLSVYEESNVMEYARSEAFSQPTLQIIENSIRPTEGTFGQSPNQLNADGRPYLELRGYALAFGLRYFGSKDYLDPETWTWFPKNRLPNGRVAHGHWRPDPDFRWVGFCWYWAGHSYPGVGARLAMSVKLKT